MMPNLLLTKVDADNTHVERRRSLYNAESSTDEWGLPASLSTTKNDAFGTFKQSGTVCNYTLVNGIAVVSSSRENEKSTECLMSESGALPPINTIVEALNGATAVSSTSASGSGIQCSPGRLYKVTVSDIDFAVCAAGLSGFTMQSSDMDVLVEYRVIPLKQIARAITNPAGCSATTSPTSVTLIGRFVLTAQLADIVVTRQLEAEIDFSWSDLSSCACKSTPRSCIFIHGLGVREELPQNQNSFEEYWGDKLPGHALCCSSMKFAVLDTENNAWTSDDLQQKTCDRILAVGNSSSKSKISDTIIITHSMGNLILAGAIATGKCMLDSTTSTWVSIAGPMSGSMASDYFQASCADKTTAVVQKYVDAIGMCPIKDAIKSMAAQSGNHSSPGLNQAYAAAQRVYQTNVDALVCSESESDLFSIFQVKFWVMHRLVPFMSVENDGMVEFKSCAGGIAASQFGTSWQNRFYKTELNHYDTTFRAGDGISNKAKMPLKWFECLL